MEKRYTLPVAIAMVVGTVIGSGVFFKAEAVLTKTGGNLAVGILAFIIMGVVMIISACTCLVYTSKCRAADSRPTGLDQG